MQYITPFYYIQALVLSNTFPMPSAMLFIQHVECKKVSNIDSVSFKLDVSKTPK